MASKLGTTGNDIVIGTGDYDNLSGLDGDDAIVGLAGEDLLYGGNGNDSLSGGDGYDTLDGGDGSDYMEGGLGDDLYYVNSTSDVVKENAGSGHDTVVTSLVYYTLAANVEELHYAGNSSVKLWGNSADNQIFASALSDTLYGGAGNDFIYGGDGSDYIYGGAGNDVIYGGAGADTMTGGSEDDYYYLGSYLQGKGDKIIEVSGGGTDTIQTEGIALVGGTGAAGETHSYVLDSEVENLWAQGKFAFLFTGNAGNNVISGGIYADTLNGGLGADTLKGGAGSDTYYLDNAGDAIVGEAVGAVDGDTVHVSGMASWTVTLGIENVYIDGGVSTLTGNSEDNYIVGTSAAELITGEAGSDWIDGKGGADTLMGGEGDDFLNSAVDALNGTKLVGGLGDDSYYIRNSTDIATELAGQGDEIAYVYADWQMGAYVEDAMIMTISGNTLKGNAADNHLTSFDGADTMSGGAGNDSLLGNAGNDSLNGGAGNDTLIGGDGDDRMVGGAGNDFYYVDTAGDVVIDGLNGGDDKVAAQISYTLTGNVEGLSLIGAALNGTGNGIANAIYGNDLANVLSGLGGDDRLRGGLGGDTLIGGSGADAFVFATGDNTDATGGRDVISGGFARGFDKIDVQGVDANLGTGADDAFVFLAKAAFTNHAGELRIEAITGGLRVLMDMTGDGAADMAIDVMGATTLTASDFLL